MGANDSRHYFRHFPTHEWFFYGMDVEIRPKLTPGAGTPRWALAAIHPGWGNRYLTPLPLLFRKNLRLRALSAASRGHPFQALPMPEGATFVCWRAHTGWIGAHWPTKGNRQFLDIFFIFPAYGKNGLRWPQIGPGGFFLLIQTLPTFWAERIWILRIFIFFIF